MKGQRGKRGGLRRWEVYLAEIDYQWAEKAVSGLKDERLTPPYVGRLVRSLAAVLD